MTEFDRRHVLTGILCGAAVAAVGLTVIPKAAQSLPLDDVKRGSQSRIAPVEERPG